jgi:cob(I)alamin adenosyltransferase
MSMRIYTRTGDQGQTGLFGGERVGKDHVRVEAYGAVDELNAALGLARAQVAQTLKEGKSRQGTPSGRSHQGPQAASATAAEGLKADADLKAVADEGLRAFDALLNTVQSLLFDVGAILATPARPGKKPLHLPTLTQASVTAMEDAIDAFEAQLPPLKNFILPSGSQLCATLHLCRGTCRRAERRVVHLLHQDSSVEVRCVVILNRLSDLLFVMARLANKFAGVADVAWHAAPAAPAAAPSP